MKFSSPYNKEDRLCPDDTGEFNAMTEHGDVYHVFEHYEGDKRRTSGKRLVRYAIVDGVAMNLIDTPLAVLPAEASPENINRWLLKVVVQLSCQVNDQAHEIELLKSDVNSIDNTLDCIQRDGVYNP